jgi:2-polyprenyl-3-methyl-5-hydroxy-6-metoxy-1,4-benzoquinol methylase
MPTATPWSCPRCRGHLAGAGSLLTCAECGATYPVVAGIPDLRIDIPSWVDVDQDRRRAAALVEAMAGRPAVDFVTHVFRSRPDWREADVSRRTREVVEGPDHLADDLDGWLAPVVASGFLDLGCGPGQLLAAAARRGVNGVGVDVMLEWLVVARALIEENGGTAVLAAGMAEALPLRSGSVGAVVSLDTIEHVGDQAQYLREIDRVVAPGGVVALATPNRFTLGPEPHVNVWGVGWLPRRWQAGYVRLRSGRPYAYCRLLSVAELRRMLARHTSLRADVIVPRIPVANILRFSGRKARVARWYNALTGVGPARSIFRLIGPFFRVVARKAATT